MAEHMPLLVLFILGSTGLHDRTAAPVPSENYPRSVELVADGALHLFWIYDKETITFEIHARTHGYVGLGLSPGGTMKGADIALGWIKDGKPFFKDWYALENGAPKTDPQQDWQMLTARETSTHTIFKFRRKLITCDKRDLDITIEPIIQKGNAGLVHHFLFYYCPRTIVGLHHGVGYNCYASFYGEKQPPIAQQLMTCSHLMAAWAVGGQDLTLPEDVGAPIGGTDLNYTGSYLIQIHYDNPTKVPGLTDASGLRFWTTPKLRKTEAGMLLTGAGITRRHFIPPHVSSFRSVGYCSRECIADVLGGIPDGIKVFSVLLHGHFASQKMRLRHLRNGTELRPIVKDDAYDPNFQDFRPVLPKPVRILPGDELMTECIYTTKTRSTVTWGGLATMEEMCVSLLYYYPRQDIYSCQTNPTWKQVFGIIDGVRLADSESVWDPKLAAPVQYANQRATKVIAQLNWRDPKLITEAEHWTTVGNASVVNTCKTTLLMAHPSDGKIIRSPIVKKPWLPPTSSCKSKPTAPPTSGCPACIGADVHMSSLLLVGIFIVYSSLISK